ncbi:MAG: hypothetical protein M1370_12055, partial [Bacteroidetes bacterium]|nr:hypothetical protein [Bacteroidota bacterium]
MKSYSSYHKVALTKVALTLLAVLLIVAGSACALMPSAPPTGATSSPVAATPVASSSSAQPTSPAAGGSTAASGSLPELSVAVRQVTQQVRPAVVQITNEQVQVGQFNQPFTVPSGVGSGVIYDNQGHILTNNHVVEGAQKL